MNALMFLYTGSLKNRFKGAIRSPMWLLKALILLFAAALFIAGAVTSVVVAPEPAEQLLLKGVMFILFLFPYWAGRFGGIGSFEMADVNFIFTAPILPRTILLTGLVRRLGDIFIISFTAMLIFSFMATISVINVMQILLVGLFCLILTAVCKLFGMYLFIAYRKVYRWIGFFWMALLLSAGIFNVYRAGWEWLPGLLALLDSYVFALTPLVGWAAAGAFAFMAGQVFAGVVYMGMLLAAGGYFFCVVYRSAPDFYEELLGAPTIAHPEPIINVVTDEPRTGEHNLPLRDIGRVTYRGKTGLHGTGAAVFFHKHIREASRASRAGLMGTDIFWGMSYAVIWGIYTRGYDAGIEIVARVFGRIGVPSGNILAVLTPLIFIMAIYPQFDRGFMELYNPYFYLTPERPWRKLLWVCMGRIIKVFAITVLVLGLAGVISRTAPHIVLATMLAYLASAFMVLGLRLAIVRLLGIVTGAGQMLVFTLPVVFFVLVGWVGMLAVFFFGPESWGLLVGLLGFAFSL